MKLTTMLLILIQFVYFSTIGLIRNLNNSCLTIIENTFCFRDTCEETGRQKNWWVSELMLYI